jgi:hydrogenase-4 component F
MSELWIWGLLAVPVAAGLAGLLLPSTTLVFRVAAAGVLVHAVVAVRVALGVFSAGPVLAVHNWFLVDALTAYELLVMAVVFPTASVFACGYFGDEAKHDRLTLGQARQYAALFGASLGAMSLVLVSNNLGLMWIGIEASTLVTAFLICVHVTPTSLEAMWKYLLVCSVGVAFAFLGTLLVGASALKLQLGTHESLLWTELAQRADRLDPVSIKAAFIFLLVGYGTKAGLAPMHSWLPDAHSQAPAPVSAIFSGFMLNTALYCVMRYLPLVEAPPGNTGWGRGLLVIFGLVSILVAAAFIVFQRDVKRLLAYSSVEHIGIITLGLGLGGVGTLAALFHTLNHSLCKTVAFCSAGRLGQVYGTHDMDKVGGVLAVSRTWGSGLVFSLLALLGAAPFAIFTSEFLVVKAAVDTGSYWTLGVLLFGLGVVFVGALRRVISMAWGEPLPQGHAATRGSVDVVLVAAPLALVLLLGVWMPPPLEGWLQAAAKVVGGMP